MEIKVENPAASSQSTSNGDHGAKTPLLESQSSVKKTDKSSLINDAVSQTFKSTAYLASRLPTGTLLTFQLLSPIFSNQGDCDNVSMYLTAILLSLCGLSCLILSFTDSVKDEKGNIYYGFVTFRGFWIIDRSVTIKPEEAVKLKMDPIDFLHSLMSLLVFAAIALLDKNVVHCFYPSPSARAQELLSVLPIGIGVICSSLFVSFPTKRHGIGFGNVVS